MMRAVSIRKIGRLAGCRRNELARGQAFTGRSEVSLPGAKRRGHFAIAAVRVGVLMAALACSACSQNRNLRPLNDAALTTAQLPNQGPSVAPVDRQASANPLPVSTPTPAIFELCDFLEAPIPDDAWAPPPLQPSNPQSNDSAFSADPAVNDHPLTFREHFRDDLHELWPEILQDHRNYYSLENFGRLVVGFSVGAALANTDADQKIHSWYQRDVRSSGSDDFAHVAKKFGEGGYVLPAMMAGWLGGECFYDTRCGDTIDEWGQRSLRSALVGTPPMLLMQYVTGGSRPVDPQPHSDWKPFSDNNGVSGHSYICALPFINAAKMTDEWPLKAGFYACSTIGGWSRINDDAHYTSQVILGWWMAFCAATAVDETGPHERHWEITPMPATDGMGMAFTYQY
jgi:hypothetical protein